ncbi:MAG: hypothetical protein ACRCWI_01550 [Brevinema sp.]
MKNILLYVLILIVVNNTYAQEETENTKVNTPLYSLFFMYMEYGFGEMSSPLGFRLLENMDVKMTYMQNFNNARWLTIGFTAQAQWIPILSNKKKPDGSVQFIGMENPTTLSLAASIGFLNNLFSVGVDVKGALGLPITYIKSLPPMPGLYAHTLTILLHPCFYLTGNQYDENGVFTRGWLDKIELRVMYGMKFTSWFGLGLWFLWNVGGTDLIKASMGLAPAKHAMMFRFNPRILFYWEDFSFFFEPRFYWFGNSTLFANKSEFQWEFKVGIDFAKFMTRDLR